MTDARPVGRPAETTPVYLCANALPPQWIPLDTAIRLAGEAGADGFELRRELLPSELVPDRIRQIRAALATLPAPPIYSTPQPVFRHGRFEREVVQRALGEAGALGCRLVKFAPGDTLRPDDREFDALCRQVAARNDSAPDLLMSLENDQTELSSDLGAWADLFERARERRFTLGMTFDLGNWDCLALDAEQAAKALGQYVVYIHAKAVRRAANGWISVPFRHVARQHPALAYLPPHAPRAIEFPMPQLGTDALCEQLRAYVTWLRAGSFDT